jgi:predicted nucleotide-binding protein (sugar kinase/HSP70/actin superfamily)
MEKIGSQTFRSLSEKVGQFRLTGKKVLIPQMNRIGGHLLAGTFRSFGVHALVMGTYKGLGLGKEFTSGKECFPCQVTTGDILLYMKEEMEKLGTAFDARNYIYFMPEADGPCRFGMYNKYQRIVLDSFPELQDIRIGALTSRNSYSLDGMLDKAQTRSFRKAGYFSVVVADVLDRLLWKIRPYERERGASDAFIEKAMEKMADAFEAYGAALNFDRILDELEGLIEEAKALTDPALPPKPLIGVVGEIYLRTHVQSNQDVIRVIEKYGGEVVNASIAEWVNYTTYDRKREERIGLRQSIKQLRVKKIKEHLKKMLGYGMDLSYQQMRQNQVYKRAKAHLDLTEDHRLDRLESVLLEEDIYSFDVGTEACLSISGILEYVRHGFNGVVNVYPFTCMPSTITSSIVKPIMNRMKVPYLDAPYDGSYQPGRESSIRTFMYQAQQHFNKQERKSQSRL